MTIRPGAARETPPPSAPGTTIDRPSHLDTSASFTPPCLSLDLEVGTQDVRIHAFGAVRPDTDQRLVFSGGNLTAALAQLDELAQGATFLLGHNLITFDLPHLDRGQARPAPVPTADRRYPVAQSALAFPRNPYHHLVKHYQDGSAHARPIERPGAGCPACTRRLPRAMPGPAQGTVGPPVGLALADHGRQTGLRRLQPCLLRPAARTPPRRHRGPYGDQEAD